MRLTTVESSMIHAVGYDSKKRVLEVVFNSGRTYCYEGVPPKVYKELMAAESKGQYMRSEIIDVHRQSLPGRGQVNPLPRTTIINCGRATGEETDCSEDWR
jgi:hypothetical protein